MILLRLYKFVIYWRLHFLTCCDLHFIILSFNLSAHIHLWFYIASLKINHTWSPTLIFFSANYFGIYSNRAKYSFIHIKQKRIFVRVKQVLTESRCFCTTIITCHNQVEYNFKRIQINPGSQSRTHTFSPAFC